MKIVSMNLTQFIRILYYIAAEFESHIPRLFTLRSKLSSPTF